MILRQAGNIAAPLGEGRLDFDSGDVAFDRVEIEAKLNELIATDAEVSTRWITDAELEARGNFAVAGALPDIIP